MEIRAQAPQGVWRTKERSRFPFCSLRMWRGGEAESPSPQEGQSWLLGNLAPPKDASGFVLINLDLNSRHRDPLG